MALTTHYRLNLSACAHNLIDASMILDVPSNQCGEPLALMMPVWTPGSYMLREFSHHVESLEVKAPGGAWHKAVKTRKNRWQFVPKEAGSYCVRWQIYARELTVRTNYICHDFALIVGAATFLVDVTRLLDPCRLSVTLPGHWQDIATGLDRADAHGDHAFVAKDFDTLVDSPVLCGNLQRAQFVVADTEHEVCVVAQPQTFDADKAAKDIKRLASTTLAMWGQLPFERYTFLHLAMGGYGGLEHKNSAVTMTPPFVQNTHEQNVQFLGLMAHEYFHAWNIKRLRPQALGPFDYEAENYTTSLWVAEGMTEYYDDLIVVRSGLMDETAYLRKLAQSMTYVAKTYGRNVQSLCESSFDAWIKFYRRDENTDNTTISYYQKGALVAFLLDAKIRKVTSGTKSLDDVMRAAYAMYSQHKGFAEEDFRAVANTVAGLSLDGFFAAYVDGTQELDFAEALDLYGLTLMPQQPVSSDIDTGGRKDKSTQVDTAYLGLITKEDQGRLFVAQVHRHGPAWVSGLNVDDEILAIDGLRVTTQSFAKRLELALPGQRLSLTICRFLRLETRDVTCAAHPVQTLVLAPNSAATLTQQTMRGKWLGAKPEPAGDTGKPWGVSS